MDDEVETKEVKPYDNWNNPTSRRRRMQTLRDQKDIKPTIPVAPWEEGEEE